VYLGALFTFFNKVFLIYKTKRRYFSWNTVSWGSSRSEAPDTPVIKKKEKKKRGYMDSFYYYVNFQNL
jgi:hypothetical protein